MPGEASVFSDVTIILIQAKSGEGKTTLANYLSKKKEHIISMDEMSFRTFNKYYDIINKVMIPNTIINSQIGLIIDRVSNNTVIVNSILENTMNEISRLIEKNNDMKCIFIEGYTLLKSNIITELINLIKVKKIRYWVCHK